MSGFMQHQVANQIQSNTIQDLCFCVLTFGCLVAYFKMRTLRDRQVLCETVPMSERGAR